MSVTSGIATKVLPTVPGRPLPTGRVFGRSSLNRVQARRRLNGWARPRVVDERVFRDALTRERLRADRFAERFSLLLMRAPIAGAPHWTSVVDAVAAAKRSTDLIGWYEQGTTLGVLMPEVGEKMVAESDVRRRVWQEMASRVDAATAASWTIEWHHHSSLTAANASQSPLRLAVKRTLDVLGSAALLVILAPVFLLIAALIKLGSPGPVFFRQERVGEGARPFEMLKFRTMRSDADTSIHQEYVRQFITANAAATVADGGAVFKITNDPRVTVMGRVLRRTSLDELPQIWNVLKGDMSLVGPRPPLQYEVEQYKPWHRRRVLEARPGITGLWQVTGRSRTTFDEMVRLDLRYARRHSIWTDIKILLATPRAVISGKGAC